MNSSIVGTYRNVCADNGSLPFNIAASMQNLGNVRLNPPGGCLVGPPPPPPPPQPGLVGWWRFNENAGSLAGDSSGNNNVGTLVGGPIWTVGKEGSALQFNGRTQRVTLPNTSTLNLAAMTDWTIAAWVNPTAISGTQYPIIYTFGSWVASLGLSDTTNGADGRLEHWRNNSSFLDSTVAIPLKQWSHLAIVRTPSSTTLYINGQQAGSGPSITINPASGSAIGASPSGSSDSGFNGRIDNVRVYDVALTKAQVQALVAKGGGPGS